MGNIELLNLYFLKHYTHHPQIDSHHEKTSQLPRDVVYFSHIETLEFSPNFGIRTNWFFSPCAPRV
jgi:hypothetical protein